ncbi:hypothetical protein PR048_015065 [Dryococelus australis]|uniref:Uncharacterized protein n=1 Tax=Dryococelus australis TaxID=614101 RepID=A0ABQ9HG69_9NEOP|nr:hypothetical protein PR048_015065 [Dryococelus australis]
MFFRREEGNNCHRYSDKNSRQKQQQGKSRAESQQVGEVSKCSRSWGKKCNKCGQLNHFAAAFKSLKAVGVDSVYISRIYMCQQGAKQEYSLEDRMIEDKRIVMKVNTGSDVNVLSLHMFKNMTGNKK